MGLRMSNPPCVLEAMLKPVAVRARLSRDTALDERIGTPPAGGGALTATTLAVRIAAPVLLVARSRL